MALLNNNNFCRFEFHGAHSIECFYAIPLVEGDTLSIWFNGELDDAIFPFATLKVSLVFENEDTYLDDIAALTEVVISGDIYQFYFSWTVPVLPPGNFHFIVFDAGSPLLISNSLTTKVNTEYTSIVKYKNSVNALGYRYESAPSVYNEFRVDLHTGNPSYNENVRGYETYEGDLIQVKSDIQKRTEFQTRFFDAGAHEAFFSMLSHSEVLIDDIEYKKSGENYDFAMSEDDDNKIGNGVVNLLEVDYSAAVKTC